ncbi:MAG: cytochrome c maturation protein CcmE [Pseudomonadota bacterium]
MKPRHKKIFFITAGVAVLGVASYFVLRALDSNIALFISPSQVAKGEIPQGGKAFRLGGLVEEGSVQRVGDGLTVRFIVTDTAQKIPVEYKGILPDLFKEGKGIVAQGRVGQDGVFRADEVLAKHDENYMPPEAAEALKKAQTKEQAVESIIVNR